MYTLLQLLEQGTLDESIKIRREGSTNNKTEWNSITLPQAAIVK